MSQPLLMPFQDLPFNGDTFIEKKFLELKEQFQITTAIETGSCFFSTTKWLAEHFDNVYTVEANMEFAKYGIPKVEGMSNVHWSIGDSLNWLPILTHKIIEERCIFFLDAHWEEHCPLLDELDIIANMGLIYPPIIAIHDFKTSNPELGYDTWNGKDFDFCFIQDALKKLEDVYQCNIVLQGNSEAVGAKRGILYIQLCEIEEITEVTEVIEIDPKTYK